MSVSHAGPCHASTYLVRAAVTAPSVYNTQPWIFVEEGRGKGIEVHADITRRLVFTDPHGREMVISCGAALFNIRLAMRHLGFNPVVRPFPRPGNAALLARVLWGAYERPTAEEQHMYRALRQRRTARGPFRVDPLPPALTDALRTHAADEGAALYCVDDNESRQHLAELVREAEEFHRIDRGHAAEPARWTWRVRSPWPRTDGIPLDAAAPHPDCTVLAGRGHADVTRTFPSPPRRWPARTGLVAVLSTDHDDRPDWLRAGQALQRILLYAAAHDVVAAFHTQPLEIPRLRAIVRDTLSAGKFPQMVLRLGYAPRGAPVPRRPAADVPATGDGRPPGGPRPRRTPDRPRPAP